ncbi:MAG TPA: hypothetical protein VMJ72_02260, partial [Candidatus Paceibacterota bacterium]|nr:hypothetical protein [Candidatus Paceibacterota bacterium]
EWASMTRAAFIAGLKWVLIEVIPPPDVPVSSPKAAENIFAGLHASYAGFPGTGWKSQFFQGKIPVSFSFEIVSNGGETHFYIRCQEDQRAIVESTIFAQYPEAEIRMVPDYVDDLPADLDLSQYDLSGAELEFTKEQAYPIKTYIEFEEAGGKDEYARIDPLAPLMETMSALRPGERLWLQYVIRATGGDWSKDPKSVKLVEKMKGKKEEKTKPPLDFMFAPIDWLLAGEKKEEKKEEKNEFNLQKLTASERKVLESIEFKLAKLAFKSSIRLVYIAPKDAFDGSRISGVTSMFKQLYYTNMNSFKPATTRDKGVLKWMFPSDVGFFASERAAKKKRTVFNAYRGRLFSHEDFNQHKAEKLCILTTEELATLWHLPGLNVKAPLMPRVQAKKGQPPAILPTRPDHHA